MSAISLALISLAYLLLLFAIAFRGDRRAAAGFPPQGGALTYALSLAVYCTSWTFFGSVGMASSRGLMYLPIYLGPTLMAALWPLLVGRMVRLGASERITSIADFLASRYGKSQAVGMLVTVIAVIGMVPYIALQLKAVSDTFELLTRDASGGGLDTAFWVAAILAVFSILFGARHIDATEHHRGMVEAIAFESVVKLVAFLMVGAVVTWGLNDGFGDLFAKAAARPDLVRLFTFSAPGDYATWIALTLLSMMAVICLPRQFQVAVVEAGEGSHVRRAAWLFPLYLVLINLFVMPVAVAGLIAFSGQAVAPDTFVLALPLATDRHGFAVLAFLGGMSAATGMVIMETVALATMVSNFIGLPLLLTSRLAQWAGQGSGSLAGAVLAVRRLAMAALLLLGYLYARLTAENFTLAGIGLLSFAAVAQFAPALLGGLFWRGAGKAGALAGMAAGFLVWGYTLFLPSVAPSEGTWAELVVQGPLGIGLLRPGALFGLTGLEVVPHGLLWSLLANIGCYVLVSLLVPQGAVERIQASLFTAPQGSGPGGLSRFWKGEAAVGDLMALSARFLGEVASRDAFSQFARSRGVADPRQLPAAELVDFTERLLAGAIGTATARVAAASVAKGEIVGLDEVMAILDENSQVIAYSHRLEQKSRELETTTLELRHANERLAELSRLKDEFIATVTHELRTPLTSIRSFSEILHDNPSMGEVRRQEFLWIVIKESERLTRLIEQVLDLSRIDSAPGPWVLVEADLGKVVAEAAESLRPLFAEKGIALELRLPRHPLVRATDRDRLAQVVVNLLSNALKFCPAGTGKVLVRLEAKDGQALLSVRDNGPGIPAWARERIFDKFQQVGDTLTSKPEGTGLGLAICRGIAERLGGRIWVESPRGGGALFRFSLPDRPGP